MGASVMSVLNRVNLGTVSKPVLFWKLGEKWAELRKQNNASLWGGVGRGNSIDTNAGVKVVKNQWEKANLLKVPNQAKVTWPHFWGTSPQQIRCVVGCHIREERHPSVRSTFHPEAQSKLLQHFGYFTFDIICGALLGKKNFVILGST